MNKFMKFVRSKAVIVSSVFQNTED